MRDIRHGDKAGKVEQSGGVGGSMPDSRDLTCNEAQVEDLLSEGESTEGEADEDGQAEKPAERKPAR